MINIGSVIVLYSHIKWELYACSW